MESVILSSPLILSLYIIAFGLSVFGLVKKAGFPITLVAVLLFAGITAYALISGATLYEAGTVAVLFFIMQLLDRAWGNQ